MERRKFVKYAGLAGIAAGLFPAQSLQAISAKPSSHLMKFAGVSTQIRHGALNAPFATRLLDEMPFQWVLDVHQNIFLKDGFQRNVDEDLNVISIALAEGEHFDALQINKQPNQIGFLWKDQCLNCDSGLPLRKIDIEDNQYAFYLGHLSVNEKLTFEQKSGMNYFVQVIDGEVKNLDNILNSESGLGLVSDRNLRQDLLAIADSKILIIERHAVSEIMEK